jgi:hypothetical protein
MRADNPTNAPESAPGDSYQTNGKRNRKTPRKRAPRPGEGRPTKASRNRLSGILEDISSGLTEEQACAVNGCSDRTWRRWKRNEAVSSVAIARARGMFIKARLRMKDACSGPEGGDWKRFMWELERSPSFREQFRKPDSGTNISLTQNNATLNLMDEKALQDARNALDEVKAIKSARGQKKEETPIEEVRDDKHPATIVPEPDDLKPTEPEPSPQSPAPAEPVERWCDKHPVEPSRRQTILAQARRMGRSDGDGKGVF